MGDKRSKKLVKAEAVADIKQNIRNKLKEKIELKKEASANELNQESYGNIYSQLQSSRGLNTTSLKPVNMKPLAKEEMDFLEFFDIEDASVANSFSLENVSAQIDEILKPLKNETETETATKNVFEKSPMLSEQLDKPLIKSPQALKNNTRADLYIDTPNLFGLDVDQMNFLFPNGMLSPTTLAKMCQDSPSTKSPLRKCRKQGLEK